MNKTNSADEDFERLLGLIAIEAKESAGLHTARVERLLDLLTESPGAMVEDDLNTILERYEFTPRFWCSPSGLQVVYGTTRRNLSREQAWEHWGVASILKFSQDQSLIARIRRCAVCSKRFLAKKNDPRHRFCNPNTCGQKFYDSKPERKAAKRDYAKEYYQKEKRANQAAAEAAAAMLRQAKRKNKS